MGWYLTIHPMPLDSYFETVIPGDANLSELDFVTPNELSHYSSIISGLGIKNRNNYNEKKEYQVYSLLVEFLERLRWVPRSSWGLSVYYPRPVYVT